MLTIALTRAQFYMGKSHHAWLRPPVLQKETAYSLKKAILWAYNFLENTQKSSLKLTDIADIKYARFSTKTKSRSLLRSAWNAKSTAS